MRIKANKSMLEIIIIVVSVLVMLVLTAWLAVNPKHYAIGFLAISLLLFFWNTQGITETGLLLMARGKEFYKWTDIGSVKIQTGEIISIHFYDLHGSKIITHTFCKTDYGTIVNLFSNKNIKTEIIQLKKELS
ncbi:MAG: hypothetical protein PWP24_1576 [Clostridiales bacterium]|nr:hypothetical protein [Clostridiales bacterium]